MNLQTFALAISATCFASHAIADDWPQWQGADRNAKSKETGLLEAWAEGGPPLSWRIDKLGGGYCAPSVAGGRIFGVSNRGEQEVVWALSEKDGSEIWASPLGATQTGGMRQGIEGSGSSPTVDGDRLYVIGHGGDLACLKTSDGEIVWRRNLINDFGGKLPTWRYNESPLVDGDKVICTPGGDDAMMVALDKSNGEVIWKSKLPGAASVAPPAGVARPAAPPVRTGPKPAAAKEPGEAPASLVAAGSTWKYFDRGATTGPGWAGADFDDSAWSEGAAELGYGDRDEKTNISNAAEHYPTYYFRQRFKVEDPGKLKALVVRVLRDDGAVVYLNGREVVRDNMPEGAIEHGTFASGVTRSESGYAVHDVATDKLIAGENIIAVEVHQASADSSDVSFDLELREKIPGEDTVGPPPRDRGRGGFASGGGRGGFGSSGAGYSSAIALTFAGKPQYAQFTSKGLIGVSASDGKLLWRYDKPSNRMGINCSTPLHYDGTVLAASAYGAGGGRVRLSADGESVKAEELWFSGDMENHHGGMVVVDGCLYGANGGNGGGYLACLDVDSGELLWDARDTDSTKARKGSIAYADGRIYYRTEEGDVLLIEPNRDNYLQRGHVEQPDRTRQPAWTHPVIANGKLYVRDQNLLLCYDISERG